MGYADIQLGIVNSNYDYRLPLIYKNSWAFTSNGHIFYNGTFINKSHTKWNIYDIITLIYRLNKLDLYVNNKYIISILNIPRYNNYYFSFGGYYKSSILLI